MIATNSKSSKRKRNERIWFWILRVSAYIVVGCVAVVLIDIIIKGAPRVDWAFLTEEPGPDHTTGGIFPALVGTICLVIGTMLIAMPIGICTAIYLNEYARDTWFTRLTRVCITNLAGIPSIVFGLFGLAAFVILLDFRQSLLAGWLTLTFMILPVIITTSEESLRAVPHGFRQGAL